MNASRPLSTCAFRRELATFRLGDRYRAAKQRDPSSIAQNGPAHGREGCAGPGERGAAPCGERPRDSRLRRHRAAWRYLAASALPIMRANVTERPQQLPVDMFGYVCA